MLTGKALLGLIESKSESTRQEIAVAAGYADKNGRAQLAKYYEALFEAKGIDAGGVPAKRGKPSSSVLHPQKSGLIVIGKTWWEAIGVGVDDEVEVTIDNDSPEAQVVGSRIILYKRVVKSVA